MSIIWLACEPLRLYADPLSVLLKVKCRDVNALVQRALEARGKTEDDVVVKKVGIDGGGGFVKVLPLI